MRRLVIAGIMGAALAVAYLVPAHASAIHLFTPKSVIERLWAGDPSMGPHCTGSRDEQLCNYQFDAYGVTVAYDRAGRAVGFDFAKYRNPSPAHTWSTVMSFVPAAARRVACKNFSTTAGWQGPAHACTYRVAGHTLLAAMWYQVSQLDEIARLQLDSNFDDIIPAR